MSSAIRRHGLAEAFPVDLGHDFDHFLITESALIRLFTLFQGDVCRGTCNNRCAKSARKLLTLKGGASGFWHEVHGDQSDDTSNRHVEGRNQQAAGDFNEEVTDKRCCPTEEGGSYVVTDRRSEERRVWKRIRR